MNAPSDHPTEKRVTPRRTACGRLGIGLKLSAPVGSDQRSVLVVMVNTCDTVIPTPHKPETVLTADFAKRTDVKSLVSNNFFTPLRSLNQIAMALAERVVDFGHHRAQITHSIGRVPETDRLEVIASDARIGL